jgi:hypothetical protein
MVGQVLNGPISARLSGSQDIGEAVQGLLEKEELFEDQIRTSAAIWLKGAALPGSTEVGKSTSPRAESTC